MPTTRIYPMRLLLPALFLMINGCVTGNVNVHEAPAEDSDYYEVYEDSTREETVWKNFETRFKVQATNLSPRFRTAFTKRLERIYLQDTLKFGHDRGKVGFFVSLYAPDDDRTDLANDQHWSIILDDGGNKVKPAVIKRMNDKERWRAFFDGISQWTYEYLVVFDATNVDPNSPDLVEKKSIKLTFANADGKVALTW
jgi:hypothetical protein